MCLEGVFDLNSVCCHGWMYRGTGLHVCSTIETYWICSNGGDWNFSCPFCRTASPASVSRLDSRFVQSFVGIFYLFINITSLFDFAVDPHLSVQLGLTVPYEAMSFLQNVKETKP